MFGWWWNSSTSKEDPNARSDLFGIKVRKIATQHLSDVHFTGTELYVFQWLEAKSERRDEGKFLLNSFSFYISLNYLCVLNCRAVRNYMRTDVMSRAVWLLHSEDLLGRKCLSFREVGNRLLERFNGASKVMGGNDGKTLIPVGQNIKPPDKQDLIYSAESPDFCLPNRKTGSLGTRGRMCNSTALDVSGCDLLCCERGHRDETVVLEENCLCRFHWCCVVQCKKCSVRNWACVTNREPLIMGWWEERGLFKD